MARSTAIPVALVLLSAGMLLASCGGNAEDRKKLAALEQSTTDELGKLTAAVEKLEAARINPNDKVHIVLRGSGAGTKITGVDHPEKHVCQHQESDCGHEVRWILQGALPQDGYVEIKEKTDTPTSGCFATPKRLDRAKPSEQSGVPDASCQRDGTEWTYSVTLYDQDGEDMSTLDPLIVVNWGP